MIKERRGIQAARGLGLKGLSQNDMDSIHYAACHILRTVGMRVEHKGAVDRLQSAGAKVSKDGEYWRVRFPEWLINDSLDSAPKAITLGARNPENDFYLEPGRVGFSTFGEQVKIIDPFTKEYRSSVRSDARMVFKVVDALEGLVVGSRTLCPNDLPVPLQQAHNFYDALTCTSKHIWMGLSDEPTLALAKEMIIAAVGAEAAAIKPINTVTACPTSPLCLVDMCCLNIIGAAESGVMNIEIMDMCLAGGTSPVTLTGTVIQTVAEQLSGLVLAQISRKGVNTLFGSCSSNMDLKSGLSPMASPENAMIATSVAAMAGYYKIPIRTGGGVSESKVPDAQAAYEYASNALPLALAGANIIWGAGGIDSGLGIDLAKLVMDHEFGLNVSYLLGGITVDTEQMALDLIEEIGPGGSFLTHKHTFKRARTQSKNDLFDRRPFATWEKGGAKTLTDRAYERVHQLIETHEPMPLPKPNQDQLEALLADFVKKHG